MSYETLVRQIVEVRNEKKHVLIRMYCNVPPDLTRHLKLIISVLVCKRQSVQSYVGAHYCLDKALLNHQWHIAQLTSDQICVSQLVPVASRQQRAWPHHFHNQPQWACWWFYWYLIKDAGLEDDTYVLLLHLVKHKSLGYICCCFLVEFIF